MDQFLTLGAKIQGLLGLPIFSTEKEKEMQLTGDDEDKDW